MSGAPAVAPASHAMEAVADATIPGDVVITVVHAAHVGSGSNGVAATDVLQGEGVVVARVTSPSTPGANSESITNGRLGSDNAVYDRVSRVDVFDAQGMAVNRSVVSPRAPSNVMCPVGDCKSPYGKHEQC